MKRRQAILLLTAMGAAVLLASGVALAANITCQPGSGGQNRCNGTEESDVIRGTPRSDDIYADDGDDTIKRLV